MHNLRTEDNSCTTSQHKLENVSRNNPRETRFFSSATQVKPCRAGLGVVSGWIKVGRWNEGSALHLMRDAEWDWHERSFRDPVRLKAGEMFCFANQKSYFLSVISGYNV